LPAAVFTLPGDFFLASWHRFAAFIIPLLVFPLIALRFSDSYRLTRIYRIRDTLWETAMLFLVTGVLLLVFFALTPVYIREILFVLLLVLMIWCFYVLNRLLFILYLRRLPDNADYLRYVLIIGTGERASQATRILSFRKEWPIRVMGYLSVKAHQTEWDKADHPVLGSVADLQEVLQKNVIDAVVVAEELHDLGTLRHIARLCDMAGIDFVVKTALISGNDRRAYVERFTDLAFMVFKSVYPPAAQLFFKRVFDLGAAGVLIGLLLPVWIVIPLLIKKDSPGPILFRQERVGRDGRRFRMFKFRSMVADAENKQAALSHLNEMDGPVFKIKEDPRITRLGHFLRKTSIDELPQLFNVFRGDMSLVGPRPPVPKEVAQYGLWQKKRLSIKPGITCLWQISGRNDVKFDEWVRLDLQYIDHWTLTLDFKILLKTFFVVLSRRGAQ
jgi:exopolysaccharide biosynthesis polyprenyl glycosylphosphotransferase